jgi:hypothetical protein
MKKTRVFALARNDDDESSEQIESGCATRGQASRDLYLKTANMKDDGCS